MGKTVQVIDSIPWVRCASGNVFLWWNPMKKVWFFYIFPLPTPDWGPLLANEEKIWYLAIGWVSFHLGGGELQIKIKSIGWILFWSNLFATNGKLSPIMICSKLDLNTLTPRRISTWTWRHSFIETIPYLSSVWNNLTVEESKKQIPGLIRTKVQYTQKNLILEHCQLVLETCIKNFVSTQ